MVSRIPSAGREWAEELDRHDPLAAFRDRFQLPQDQTIYLDGNSLGMMPKEAMARLTKVAQWQWGDRLIRSWSEDWLEAPSRIGDLLGQELLGAQAGEVVITDSVSVNLYKLINAALDAGPDRTRIVSERAIFPTDRYILEGVARARGLELVLLEAGDGQALTPEEVSPAVDQSTALLLLQHVDYRSAAITEMAAMNQIASQAGALTLWDLCHSVGVVPVELEASRADLAVGCTYKYLNSGPGAPAFLYVRRHHQKLLRQPIWGWFSQADQFAMEELYRPPASIARFQVGTPNILGTSLVQLGVELTVEAGLGRVRTKAMALTELARFLHQQWLLDLGYGFASPKDPNRRGAHVSLRHPSARAICAELGDHRVVVDYRPPDLIRFGLAPLTVRFTDVWDALNTLRQFCPHV